MSFDLTEEVMYQIRQGLRLPPRAERASVYDLPRLSRDPSLIASREDILDLLRNKIGELLVSGECDPDEDADRIVDLIKGLVCVPPEAANRAVLRLIDPSYEKMIVDDPEYG